MQSETKSIAGQSGFYRDILGTVQEDGKRKWLYPKRPKGTYYKYRWMVAVFLLAVFFILPWIRYQGEPFLMINILERKFILFGKLFWPQDFHLLVMMVISFIVFIILFTVIFGRLFCGWVCPQTIFLEFIYRQIEYLIEGGPAKQKKLAAQEWDFEKTWKKSLKHFIFFMIALLVIHNFLAYIIGTDRVIEIIKAGPLAHFKSFVAVILFASAFYFVYAFFREQVCTLVCPYGRLQGVLLDNKSIIVAYDYKRGEPRGRRSKKTIESLVQQGDCVDCLACVSVCPTGIDIRNGTQLECINCTACIDACNAVMQRLSMPKGLIRYASEASISGGHTKIFNARSIAYSFFLTILLAIVVVLFSVRPDVEATVLRLPGTMFQAYGDDSYSNIFKVQLVNKTRDDKKLELRLDSQEGEVILMGDPLLLEGASMLEANFLIVIPKAILTSSSTKVNLGVYHEGERIESAKTTFIAPNKLDSQNE